MSKYNIDKTVISETAQELTKEEPTLIGKAFERTRKVDDLSIPQLGVYEMGAVLLKGIDILGNSLPLVPDNMGKKAAHAVSDELGAVYDQYEPTNDLVGSIGLIGLSTLRAPAMIRDTSFLAKSVGYVAGKDSAIMKIFTKSKSIEDELAALEAEGSALAKRGMSNFSSASREAMAGAELESIAFSSRLRKVSAQSWTNSVKNNLAIEGAIYATTNQSDTFFKNVPGDDLLMLAGVGVGSGILLDRLAFKHTVGLMMNSIGQNFKEFAEKKEGKEFAKTLFRTEATAGAGISASSFSERNLKEASLRETDANVKSQLEANIAGHRNLRKKGYEILSYGANNGLSFREELSQDIIVTADRHAMQDENAFINARSLVDATTDEAMQLPKRVEQMGNRARKKVKELDKKRKKNPESYTAEDEVAFREALTERTRADKTIHTVMKPDGTVVTPDSFIPTADELGHKVVEGTLDGKRYIANHDDSLRLRSDGYLVNPEEGLTTPEIMDIYQMGRQLNKHFDGKTRFAVTRNSHYSLWDVAHERAKVHGLTSVALPRDITTMEQLEMEVLSQKLKGISSNLSGMKSIHFVNQRFNLNPDNKVGEFLISLASTGRKTIPEEMKNLERFKSELSSFAGLKDVKELKGTLFEKFEGKSVLVQHEGIPGSNLKDQTWKTIVDASHAANRESFFSLAEKDQFFKDIIDVFAERPEMFKVAGDVNNLRQHSFFKSVEVTPGRYVKEDYPQLAAADALGGETYKRSIINIKNILQDHQEIFHNLKDPKNYESLTMFSLAKHALQSGWRTTGERFDLGNGMSHLVLDHTDDWNLAKYQELFGRELQEGDFLPQMTGKLESPIPVAVDGLAEQALQTFNALSKRVLELNNHLRSHEGKYAIRSKPDHILPENLRSDYQVNLFDATGQHVQTLGGNDYGLLMQRVNQEIEAAYSNNGQVLTAKTMLDMEHYFDTLDEIYKRPDNFQFVEKQSGRSKGKSVGSVVTVDPQIVDDLVESYSRQLEAVHRRVVRNAFEPEINVAMHRQATAQIHPNTLKLNKDVYSLWTQSLYQRQGISPDHGISEFSSAVEKLYDAGKDVFLDNYRAAFPKIATDSTTKEEFKRLDEALGKFNPWKDAEEYVLQTTDIRRKQTLKRHMGALMSFTTNTMLRMANLSMMALNLLTVPAFLPPVIRGLERRAGETDEIYFGRIGAWATTAKDSKIGMWDATRASVTGMHYLFTEEGKKILQESERLGYISHEISERLQIMTHASAGSLMANMNKMVDFLSKPTDWSEKMSRGISLVSVYKFGRDGMGLSHEEAMRLGARAADQVVGDYRPAARPQLFQTPATMPLGLFTTFIWNFWQRMFSELGARRASNVVMQGVLQQSLFGAESLPGYQTFVDQFTTSYDGQTNIIDRLRKSGVPDWGIDYFLNGSLSSMPKVLGAQNSLALGTKASLQIPTIWPPVALASAQTYAQGAYELVRDSLDKEGLTGEEVGQVMSNYQSIQLLRAGADLLRGYDTDKQGNVINPDLYNPWDVTSKILGIQTIKDRESARVIQRSRVMQAARADALQNLSRRVESLSRGNDFTQENIREVLNEFTDEIGGTPEMARNWFARRVIDSKLTPATKKLIESIGRTSWQPEGVDSLFSLSAGIRKPPVKDIPNN